MSEENPTSDKPAETSKGSIFGYSGFNKLFLGSLSGKLADRLYQMAMVAAAFVVFAGNNSENQLAYIQIVATVPLFFAYTFMGTWIDTTDRRRLMFWLMSIKCVLVLGLVPILWGVKTGASETELAAVRSLWLLGLGVIFCVSFIDGPFGPARAAAVPDVVPLEKQQLGASLMATSGLISLLLGTFLGGQLAQTRRLGPALTIFVCSALYILAALLLRSLPDAVAVPANKRGSTPESIAPKTKQTWGQYFGELWKGFSYSGKTIGIMDLVFFETCFWCLASLFYLLFAWFLDFGVRLYPDDKTEAFSYIFLGAGIGLFGGAISAGRMARHVSPILTYPASFLIMGLGVVLMFAPLKMPPPRAATLETVPTGTWVLAPVNGALKEGRIDTSEKLPKLDSDTIHVRWEQKGEAQVFKISQLQTVMRDLERGLLGYLAFAGFLVGLGGGLMLGRVDADILSIAAPDLRGRVFSVKAMAFTLALVGVMGPLSASDDGVKKFLAVWFGPGILCGSIIAFFLSWRVDVAIWRDRLDTDGSGALNRLGYWLVRSIAILIMKIWFRYEVKGAEKIPASGAVVLAANHASFADPLILGCATSRTVQYIMYSSYYRSIAHPIFRLLRCIPVDEKSASAAMKAGIRSLKKGVCVGIFPEGRVSENGQLQPPMGGALFMAQKSGAIVVPVALKGNAAAFGRSMWFPRPRKVTVIVGEPFQLGPETSKEEMTLRTEQLMRDLATMLELPPPEMDKPKSATSS